MVVLTYNPYCQKADIGELWDQGQVELHNKNLTL